MVQDQVTRKNLICFSEKIVSEEKEEIEKLEEQTALLSSEEVTEEQLQDILKQIQEEEALDDQREAEHNDWLAKREAKILEIKKILTTTTTAPKSKHDRHYFSDQSGSELDSAADSPLVTENLDQESSMDTAENSSLTQSLSTSTTAPLGVSSSPSSSPLLTALLHSPSKSTSFPTSPVSHYPSNPYKTPTQGTNLLHKFSPATISLPTTPLSVTTASAPTISAISAATAASTGATPKPQENSDKEEDILADIDELLKDKLSEGEITKEDIALAEVKEEEKDLKDKDELKEESADYVKPVDTEFSESSKKEDFEKEEEKTVREKSEKIDVKKEISSGDKSQEIAKPKIPESAQETGDSKSVQGLDGVESVPGSPLATPVGSRSMTPTPTTTPPSSSTKSVTIEEDRDYRAWKKSIILVWNQISQHKNANLFVNAVTEADAPDYRDIVFRPMDLNSIKRNVESGHIRTTEEFERDLMLMFFNATMYNSSDHEVYKLTKDMHEDTEKILTDYKNAQLLMKESEPKSLRGKSESADGGGASSRPRGRSVSGSVETPVTSRSERSETRKRERSGSLMVSGDTEAGLTRAEKKRKL